MLKASRRLLVIRHHLHTDTALCTCSSAPVLSVDPLTCLVDEKIHIKVTGLHPGQFVTLTSCVKEAGNRFEARGVYKASKDGTVDANEDPCLAGTYTDVEPMGLFWSLKLIPRQQSDAPLIKKDVTTPFHFTIGVYDGTHVGDSQITEASLTSASVSRLYMSPAVRRIPLTDGPYRGTIFIPEGDGPFPGLMDISSSLVSLIETRAALLAFHGYATFALSYLYLGHLPKMLMSVDPNYVKEAADWFSQQDYVDADRFGAFGLCYGGILSLMCASMLPKMRALVCVNALPVMPSHLTEGSVWAKTRKVDRHGNVWPNPDLVYNTDEGLVLNEVYDTDDLMCIPAWRHGAKVLVIVGDDDKQIHPKYHEYLRENWPETVRANLEMVHYEGAGHIIDTPYSPLFRATKPGRARIAAIDFVKKEFRDEPIMCGGFPKQHALAQEDSWRRALDFLHAHLKETKKE